jgi:hypothetical protein
MWTYPLARAVCLIGLLVMVAVIGRYALDVTAHHDEYQYFTAAMLWPDLALYRDFHYSQTPYFPVALSWWIGATGGDSPYLAAKIFNLAWSVIFILTLWSLTRWISRSGLIATLITFAVTASPILSMVLVVVRNDIMAVSLGMAGLALVLLASDREKSGRARTLALFGGVFLALATGTKQSFVILPLSAVVFTLFLSSAGAFRHRILDLFLPLVLGGIAGSLPAIALALVEWPNFLFATAEFHLTAHAEWSRRHSQSEFSGTVLSFLRLAKYMINGSNVFLAVVMATGLCLALPNLARSPLFSRSTREGRAMLLALTGIAFGTPLMLTATPLHVHYTAPLLLFQAIGCAAAAHALWGQVATPTGRAVYLLTAGLIVAGVAVFAFLNPRPTGHPVHDGAYHRVFQEAGTPDQAFASARMARIRAAFHDILGPADPELCFATLMPLYPLEAGYNVYPQFAGSPFFYKVNDMYEPNRLRDLNGLAPGEVYDWLGEVDARALLIGFDADLEGGFREYAQDHGFQAFEIDLRDGHDYGDKEQEPIARLLVSPDRLAGAGAGASSRPLGHCP